MPRRRTRAAFPCSRRLSTYRILHSTAVHLLYYTRPAIGSPAQWCRSWMRRVLLQDSNPGTAHRSGSSATHDPHGTAARRSNSRYGSFSHRTDPPQGYSSHQHHTSTWGLPIRTAAALAAAAPATRAPSCSSPALPWTRTPRRSCWPRTVTPPNLSQSLFASTSNAARLCVGSCCSHDAVSAITNGARSWS